MSTEPLNHDDEKDEKIFILLNPDGCMHIWEKQVSPLKNGFIPCIKCNKIFGVDAEPNPYYSTYEGRELILDWLHRNNTGLYHDFEKFLVEDLKRAGFIDKWIPGEMLDIGLNPELFRNHFVDYITEKGLIK
jgi:hypothetical protein